MSKMKVKDNKSTSNSVHGGMTGKAISAPSGYAVKGKTSVDADACRESTAPTPASIGERSA